MKRFILFFFFGLILHSCQTNYITRNIEYVNIKQFNIESTNIRAIHAISKDHLYFAGSNGYIGYTLNEGKSWHIKQLNYQDSIIPHFRSVSLNNSNLFALSIGNPALLYKISKNSEKLVYIEHHKDVFYDSMKFFSDGKHGIAVGDPIENCPSIILTSDGGNTWQKIPCSQLPKFEKGEAFFAASNTNIKIIDNTVWIASGGKKARILKSEDTGKTWTVYDTPIVQGNGSQGIYSIDFYDKKNGIVIGGSYASPYNNCANKAITTDGGITWNLIADNQEPSYKSCVQYIPNTKGQEIIAVGKTGISFSNDGGLTWNEISKDNYYTIQFIDTNTAWLSGNQKIGKLTLN
ncbi:Oxidoreductase [Tenacibaculum maritimum]|uniref:WD40/YVTN/BNR-like repeat-containing protein n=1 Tax=Tenacibaculum maritimum TaxID=107401 RepID=UPI0012E5A0A6|nr:oxidoreductase [Tenacibaculum maritimum]CAA0147950.1 Oxidoreductase [Tenacibaculum maritimum]CAA0193756.1 Oxidoreductase [Tenacibaculum maritimum]CAA0201128.1 Oxidoreductase [Tenacibaculum maritimum]